MNLKSLQQKIDELNRQYDRGQTEIMSLRGRLAELSESLQRLEKTGSVAEIANCRAERQQFSDRIAGLEAKREQILNELAGLDRAYHEISERARQMQNQAAELKIKLGPGGVHRAGIDKLTREFEYKIQILKNSQAVDQQHLASIERWLSENSADEPITGEMPENHRLAGRSQRVIWW